MTVRPTSVEEVQEAVRDSHCLLPRGGGSKRALSTPVGDAVALEVDALTGVLEYDPAEYTFTALGGTTILEVAALLEELGQYLPFDPPFVKKGATLAGTVAAGLSGPGRYRFGGVRDFLLGVRFVDGQGNVRRGGGKVVKNAAGFDLPKLFVGSLGRLGVLVELTFKVFPAPRGYTTLLCHYPTFAEAMEAMTRLRVLPLEVDALDLDPEGRVVVRIGGLEGSFGARLDRLQGVLGNGEILEGAADAALWEARRELAWVPDGALVARVPLTLQVVPAFDRELQSAGAEPRYSVGGNLAWVAWPASREALDELLMRFELTGLLLEGPPGNPLLGRHTPNPFARRVKEALDPHARFPE